LTAGVFSAVIPTYNCANKLRCAVESVLAQTFPDYEIWVIDDGSTDDTRAALEPFSNQLNYVYQANSGVAAARNRGIECARGDYVAFLDADDRWYPHKLERVAQAVQSNPDVGLYYSQVDFYGRDGSMLWTYRSQDSGVRNYRTLLETDYVMTSSAVVRKSCFAQVGGFDVELSRCQDWDMWIRIARAFPIRLIPETLVAYQYMGAGSLTSAYLRWVEAHDRVMEKAFAADPQLGPAVRWRVRSAVAHRKGKIYLAAGDEAAALHEFRQSVKLRWGNGRSWLYWVVLRHQWVRRALPGRVKWKLRLPEVMP